MAARAGRTGRGSWVFECCSGGPPACRRAGHPARRWSLDSLDPLKSHFSLPFPGTLSHTLSERTEFESNECRGQRGGLSGSTAVPQDEWYLTKKSVGFQLVPCDRHGDEKETPKPKANEM